MRVRRSQKELKLFKQLKADYIADGYPSWYAEEQAWSVIMLDRQIRLGAPVGKA